MGKRQALIGSLGSSREQANHSWRGGGKAKGDRGEHRITRMDGWNTGLCGMAGGGQWGLPTLPRRGRGRGHPWCNSRADTSD